MNVNGSLRDFKLDTQDWIGVDLEEGNGVDKVLESPYEFPFSNDSFDIVLASSVFEHVDFFGHFLRKCTEFVASMVLYILMLHQMVAITGTQ